MEKWVEIILKGNQATEIHSEIHKKETQVDPWAGDGSSTNLLEKYRNFKYTFAICSVIYEENWKKKSKKIHNTPYYPVLKPFSFFFIISVECSKLNLFLLSTFFDLLLPSFPHVLGRMGHMELMDRKLFCLCALDFYRQLTEDSHKRAFVSTFQTIAAPDSPYGDLVQYLPPAV